MRGVDGSDGDGAEAALRENPFDERDRRLIEELAAFTRDALSENAQEAGKRESKK